MINSSKHNNRVLYHMIFWLIALISWLLIIFIGSDFKNVLRFKPLFITFVFNITFATAVYVNLRLLMPFFLKKRKFILYVFLLLLDVGLVALFLEFLLVYPLNGFLGEDKFFKEMSLEGWLNFFIFTMVYVGITTFLSLMREWLVLQRVSVRLKEAENEKLEAELKILKTQVNPHFLFNTLNNLYSLTLDKSDKAPDLVLKLSDMMRYILYECNDKYVPVEKEIDFLTSYIELQRIRLDEAIPVRFDIVGNIDDRMIAPLLLEPLVENAFKHGIYSKNSGGFVDIIFNFETIEEIKVTIKNRKEKLWETPQKLDGGIGLRNVKRRLSLLYPKKYKLNIENKENEFVVELMINLEK